MSVTGERMKQIMKLRGITQAEISKRTGIPKSAVSQYLSDRFKPKPERLRQIAAVLETTPAWLMGFSDTIADEPELILTEDEKLIISEYRSRPEIRAYSNSLLKISGRDVFRAAKSQDGTAAPTVEMMAEERLKLLNMAPETNEDL